jgi:hypothetical protein
MAVSAYGQYQQGQAAKKAGAYQAQMDENNAKNAEVQALDASLRGESERAQLRANIAETIAQGKAGFAGGNVDLSVGAPNFWERSAQKTGAEDIAQSRVNTANEMAGLYNSAAQSRNQAALSRWGGRNSARAGGISAAGTILSGAAQAGASAYLMSQKASPATTSSAERWV